MEFNKLTEDDIREINSKTSISEYGIYNQPYGIPVHIKTDVIYDRKRTGGYTGGSCWGGNSEYFTDEYDNAKFEALDLALERICPNISFLQFRKIENLIETNEKTEYEYYGNSDNFLIKYIVLEKLYEFLERI